AADTIAAALSLTTQEIGFENHLPSAFNAGVPFVFVPVRNLAAIAKAAPQPAAWGRAFGDRAAYLYTRETEVVARQFHARMFVEHAGGEDPATGSAAVALAGVVQRFDAHPSGTHRLIIEQGFEMGRPSIIEVELDVGGGGGLEAVRVAGEAVVVARGEIDV
ncbi:MAG: PhzF family phenazine biosynthesis protein, partial [Bauldia sp.]|nr:PhzF family phenazine biosynthesis protein [Bauldia sp.]